jgi:cellobiose-specific phosphotransferase system component IIC
MKYIFLIVGILILITGKVRLSKRTVVSGKAAYFLSISYMFLFAITFLSSFVQEGVSADICSVISATAFYIVVVATILVVLFYRSSVDREAGAEKLSSKQPRPPSLPPVKRD